MRIAYSLAALLLLVAVAAAQAQDQRRTFTLASYNVENMFDVYDDPYASDETAEPKPRRELEQLAAAIRAMDADVVALVELENEGLLRAFAFEMLSGMGYQDIAVLPTNSDRGINLGVMSRLPVLSITSHRFQPLRLDGDERTWRFARDAMLVRVQVAPDLVLNLIVLHLKSRIDSKNDKNSASWRLAEATAIRRIIDDILARDPEAHIAVVGDLNDESDTATLATLRGLSLPPQQQLADLHADLPPAERITYRIEPYRSKIDYILASPALARRVVPGSAKVLQDPAVIGGSDHCPIYATFKLD